MKRTFSEAMETVDRLSADLNLNVNGYSKVGRHNTPGYRRSALAVQQMVEGAHKGGIDPLRLKLMMREAQSTSDFPSLMGDNLHRYLLGRYAETAVSWPSIAYRRINNDFRNVKAISVDGGESHLGGVAELAPYPQATLTDTPYSVAVTKFGRRMGFSWESFINDDLGGLRDTPLRFGRAARRSEERDVTNAYCANATFFSSGNKNIVNTANGASGNNPILAAGAITDALTVMRSQVDVDGEPIIIDGITLVVPTALDETANRILSAQSIWWNELGGTANQRLIGSNTLPARISKVCAPYLDILGGGNAKTQWYLFANPSNGRPAIQIAFLRGHESPEMWVKNPDAQMVGGGTDDFMNGSFDNDQIDYKVRHVYGVGLLDPKMAVTSKGTGAP